MNPMWLDKGVAVFTKEDILFLFHENNDLKKTINLKLIYCMPLLFIVGALTVFLTIDITTPKVGDIGVFDPNGETTLLTPTINPRPTKGMAFNFATNAALRIRTFFFATYYEDVSGLEPLFTPQAFNDYLELLNNSGLLRRVKGESINVTAALSAKNSINAINVIEDNTSYYYVRVVLILRLENLSGVDEFSTEEFLFKLEEVDRGRSKYGLLISSMESF